MTATLTLTTAGRTAIANGIRRATRYVEIRRLAIGTGTAPAGTDDSARTALRAQREIVAVSGSTTVPGRIAIRADYTPDAAYAVTEVGLFATQGTSPAEFLAAYWVAPSAATAVAATADGAALVLAGIVEITSAGAGALTITPSLTVQVGAPGQATTSRQGLVELATTAEATAGTDTARAVTPAGLAARTPNASTGARGLVELATTAEAQAGTDTERAVTPAGAVAAARSQIRAGVVTADSGTKVAFGSPFTTRCDAVVIVDDQAVTTGVHTYAAYDIDRTGFHFVIAGGGRGKFYYIAVGA